MLNDPATVQLNGSDNTVSLPLAQHATVAMLAAGGQVLVGLLDPQDPSEGIVLGAF